MKSFITILAALFLIAPWHANAQGTSICVAEGNWSSPATWGGTVPQAGSHVTIPAGRTVYLDVTPPNLGKVLIEGHLKVLDTGTRAITAQYILAQHGGVFSAGTEAQPFQNKLTVTLTGTDSNAVLGMGGRLLGAHHGSKIELIGATPSINWTFLNATAAAGANVIILDQAPGWKVGDEIIITSTDYDYAQTEKRTIVGISQTTITLNAPLTYLHNGQITYVDHDKPGVPHTIDERAEVGLLSHNIKIQGASDSETAGYGGHTMVMDTSVAKLRGVEFYRMGQKGLLGRYPMHWHDVNDEGENSFMENCSTHRSFNRGTTIHKTNNLRITGNVIYDTLGHGYFFEDGKETGNTLIRNLVALVHMGVLDTVFLKDGFAQPNGGVPAAYWISNPNNHFIGNVAAGQAPGGIGFWYDLHTLPRPGSITAAAFPSYNPKAQPFGVFEGNRAHSVTSPTQFSSQEPAWGLFVEQVGAVIENFTAFKNQKGCVWTAGRSIIQNSSLAGDLAVFNPSTLKNSLVIGRTPNPIFVEPSANTWLARGFDLENGLAGKLLMADTALDGYDALPAAENSVFANFRGIFRSREHNVYEGSTSNCKFLNDGPYRTYYVGNANGFTAAVLENSQFAREELDDSFGNGGPGFFTYTQTLTDERSKTVLQGAKGIEPSDTVQWWTPGRITDFVSFQVHDAAPSTAAYRVLLQRAGAVAPYQARWGPDFNNGYVHQSNTKPGLVTKLAFTGTIQNEDISIKAEDPKPAGVFLLFTLPMWTSGTPTFYHERQGQQRGNGQAPPQASTKAAYDAATATTYYVGDGLIHVKLLANDSFFLINNYSTSSYVAPSPSPFNQWLGSAFSSTQLNDPAFSSFAADPQNDGVTNGMEYVLATGPGLAEKPPATVTKFVSGSDVFPRIVFRRAFPSRGGVNLIVEQSPNLVSWTPIATLLGGASTWSGTASVSEETPASGLTRVLVTSSTKIDATNPSLYLRLRAVQPQ